MPGHRVKNCAHQYTENPWGVAEAASNSARLASQSKRKKVVVTKGVNLSHNNLHTIRHLPEALAPYMSFHK